MSVQWLGVSHRVGSALYYCIISDKGKVLSCTIIHQITADKPRDTKVQEQIRDYHCLLEAALGSEDFGNILDCYDFFVNIHEEGAAKGDPNEEE